MHGGVAARALRRAQGRRPAEEVGVHARGRRELPGEVEWPCAIHGGVDLLGNVFPGHLGKARRKSQ